MNVLITGRGGFWGQHQAAFLESKGYSISSVGYASAKWRNHNVIDMGHKDAWQSVIEQRQPQIILHLAGVARGEAEEMERVNVSYTEALLDACKTAAWKPNQIFLAGSGAEYGAVDSLPITEESDCNPCGLYGQTKLKQTQVGLKAYGEGLPVTVIRPFNVLGVGMPERLFLADVMAQLKSIIKAGEEPILQLGDLSTVRDFIDVRDLCEATHRLMQSSEVAGEIINLCSGRPVVMKDLLTQFLGSAGCSHFEIRSGSFGGGIQEHFGAVDKLQSITGFSPSIPLASTLTWIATHEFEGAA